MPKTVFALDIGGSSIKSCSGTVYDGERIEWGESVVDKIISPTFPELRRQVGELIHRFDHLDAIGISTAGTVDLNGQVLRAGAFKGYEHIHWQDELRDMGIPYPVAVLNDGHASTLAEFHARRDRARLTAVHFVIGTGIGGGAIVSGELLRGEAGYAGALGHIKVVSGKAALECRCRGFGCVQTLASVGAVVERYEARLGRLERLSRSVQPNNVLSQIPSLNRQKLSALESAMAECGYYLGRAIGSAINVFNPGIVTLGGGLIQADNELAGRDSVWGPYVGTAFAEAKRASIVASGEFAILRVGALGNEAGVRGAGIMAAKLL